MKKIMVIILLLLTISACGGRYWGGDGGNIRVRRGDTLYSISRAYNVPLKDLIVANSLSAPYTLRVGQSLRLPIRKYHVVQKGESLYGISKMYNVDITTLSKVNHLRTPYALYVGQRLALPASVSGTTQYTSPQTSFANEQNTLSKYKTQKYVRETSAPVRDSYVVSKARKTKFDWPVKGTIISGYGNLGSGRKNDGINIKAPLGTNVKAADGGTVAYAGNELKGFGNLILIKHPDGWITAYAHNEKIFVKKGQRVVRGEKIATVGSTGSVTTPQLHFEVRSAKKAVNPRPYLP